MSTSSREPNWQRSCGNATCVEVAELNGRVLVRDSKDPDGPMLSFDRAEWAAFTDAIKAGKLQV